MRGEDSNLDEIANEVHRLLQAVPDGCEDPQAVILELAKAVESRQHAMRLKDLGRRKAESSAPGGPTTAAGELLVKNAFRSLDPEAQTILRMQLSDGCHYRMIAERLNMQPSQVLRILRMAYSQLRWHTASVDQSENTPP